MNVADSAPAIPNRLNLAIMAGQLLSVAGCIAALKWTGGGWSLRLLAMVFMDAIEMIHAIPAPHAAEVFS